MPQMKIQCTSSRALEAIMNLENIRDGMLNNKDMSNYETEFMEIKCLIEAISENLSVMNAEFEHNGIVTIGGGFGLGVDLGCRQMFKWDRKGE